MNSPSKSCSLDPLPTDFLKQCVDILSPIITDKGNMSIASACIPSSMKEAIVIPLLKKKTLLDPDQLKNYRPVSSLSFISNLIDVAARLFYHLQSHFDASQTLKKHCVNDPYFLSISYQVAGGRHLLFFVYTKN